MLFLIIKGKGKRAKHQGEEFFEKSSSQPFKGKPFLKKKVSLEPFQKTFRAFGELSTPHGVI
jgi:hypothetical protein